MTQTEKYLVEITREELDFGKLYAFCLTQNSGAIDVFIGTVRDHFEGQKVDAMEYHGYPEMGEKVLKQIAESAHEKWPLSRVAVQHRLGLLQLKEASVIIAVSSPHRAEAFEACRYIIEEIKKDLPVWKKEYFAGGEAQWKEDSIH
jgi:molybdopterin synthase catalytic subunit